MVAKALAKGPKAALEVSKIAEVAAVTEAEYSKLKKVNGKSGQELYFKVVFPSDAFVAPSTGRNKSAS